MSQLPFKELSLSSEINSAIDAMGFTDATEIQWKAIPIIKEGNDVIGRSQTGTGKTLAFGIPAVESIDSQKNEVQVLILCPTRELAVQASNEILNLSKFKREIKVVDIYGGVAMINQISRLKTANIVVGTPGRVMDHLRRKTLNLQGLKMIVLDEADEMLSMGFRDDIETILQDAPEQRQTILFSATMPPEILILTKKFQKQPKLIEINKRQVTVENISQCYYNVHSSQKIDALCLLLLYYCPKRSIIFCNTKKMVDVLSSYLQSNHFKVESLHGDMKQSQRNSVMNLFKQGNLEILIATDVAARGIDVNDIDYVINYDIPQNVEYYVHRIGRTGRAGKSGMAITICSGRSQVEMLTRIGRFVKSRIKEEKLPKADDIRKNRYLNNINEIEDKLKSTSDDSDYKTMLSDLLSKGYDLSRIATAALESYFEQKDKNLKNIKLLEVKPTATYLEKDVYQKIVIDVGRAHHVEPNHIVGAITGQSGITGKEIGKIEIFDKKATIAVPRTKAQQIVRQMKNCKICGYPITTVLYQIKSTHISKNEHLHRNIRKHYK